MSSVSPSKSLSASPRSTIPNHLSDKYKDNNYQFVNPKNFTQRGRSDDIPISSLVRGLSLNDSESTSSGVSHSPMFSMSPATGPLVCYSPELIPSGDEGEYIHMLSAKNCKRLQHGVYEQTTASNSHGNLELLQENKKLKSLLDESSAKNKELRKRLASYERLCPDQVEFIQHQVAKKSFPFIAKIENYNKSVVDNSCATWDSPGHFYSAEIHPDSERLFIGVNCHNPYGHDTEKAIKCTLLDKDKKPVMEIPPTEIKNGHYKGFSIKDTFLRQVLSKNDLTQKFYVQIHSTNQDH